MDDQIQTESPAVEENTGVSETLEAETASSPDVEDVEASPSDAPEESEATSMIDAVRKAVKPAEEEDESDVAEAQAEEPASDEAATSDTEYDESQDENLPFGKHPRFKQLVSQRNELRQQIEQMQPAAQEYQEVRNFMDQNNLNDGEVAQALQILALLKSDPLAAKEAMKPTLDLFAQLSGDTIPQDIKQRLDEGYLDEQGAKELAALRARTNLNQHQQIEGQRQAAERQQAEMQRQQSANLYSAVANWEQQIASRDADYAKLQPLVMQATQAALANGRPQTPEQALQIVEAAYKQVQENVKAFMPKKAAQRTLTSTNSVSTAASPKPTSLLEAVTQAANN